MGAQGKNKNRDVMIITNKNKMKRSKKILNAKGLELMINRIDYK